MIRRAALFAFAIVAVSAGHASAQQSRSELLRTAVAAYDDFAPERALDLLKAAVNPALGPADTSWARGVHLLTQILVEGGNQELAKTWARWATRLAPDLAIDSVNFVAGAVQILRESRALTSARTSGDAVTQTTWRWVPRGSSERTGRIVVDPARMSVPVNVRVVGGGLVPTGVGLSLPPGSYEIEAGASGYLPARLTREVLPGVTTVLAFSLTSAAVASDVIPESARQHTFQNAAALSVRRFMSPPACAAAGFLTRDGLLVTSYSAIRGADSVIAQPATGAAQTVRIAAWDVAGDLAVLQFPSPRTDSIAIAATVVEGQSAWALRYADCRTPADVRTRVTLWNDRPRGALQLGEAPQGAALGSPLVDFEGRLAGVWTGGESAVPGTRVTTLLETARRNATARQLASAGDVARRENHAYGSVVVASDVAGATARMTPLEAWHWPALAASGNAPFTFAGPMGRYRLEVTGPGNLRREQEVTIRPGVHDRVMVPLRQVATTTPGTQPVAKKRSKMPWILGGVALVAGGAAAAMGGGGGGGEPPPPPPPGTGSIRVVVPINPP